MLLEAKTSLPKDWLSIVKNGDGPAIAARTIYRDMQANVDVPDDLFELPKGVEFTEVTAAELMSTPLPAKPAAPPPAKSPIPVNCVEQPRRRSCQPDVPSAENQRLLLTLALAAVSLIIVKVYRFSRAFCRAAEGASRLVAAGLDRASRAGSARGGFRSPAVR